MDEQAQPSRAAWQHTRQLLAALRQEHAVLRQELAATVDPVRRAQLFHDATACVVEFHHVLAQYQADRTARRPAPPLLDPDYVPPTPPRR